MDQKRLTLERRAIRVGAGNSSSSGKPKAAVAIVDRMVLRRYAAPSTTSALALYSLSGMRFAAAPTFVLRTTMYRLCVLHAVILTTLLSSST